MAKIPLLKTDLGTKLNTNRASKKTNLPRVSSGKFSTATTAKAERGSLTKSLNKVRNKNAKIKVKNMLDGGTSLGGTVKGRAKIQRTLIKQAVRIGKNGNVNNVRNT